MNITREQVVTLLSCAVAVSSIFVIISQGNQIDAYQNKIESLQSNLTRLEAGNEIYRLGVAELEREAADYKSRIVELQKEVARNEHVVSVWRTYRDQLEEAYVENAKLKGLLLEREIDEENFTAPMAMPRKETFSIGDTVTFIVESEVPFYGSFFNIWDPEGSLIWEGDPIGNWFEVQGLWVTPFYGQTAYLEPMVIEEDMLPGRWTWSYRFNDIFHIEGSFTVEESP